MGAGGQVHGSRVDVIIEAAKEVGPSLFFSLLVITVGFLPVFTLAGPGRAGCSSRWPIPRPSAMLFASFLAITLTPVLMTLFIRGKIRPEDDNPISVSCSGRLYHPVSVFALRFRYLVIVLAIILLVLLRSIPS